MAFIDVSLHLNVHRSELRVSINKSSDNETFWIDLTQYRKFGDSADDSDSVQVAEVSIFTGTERNARAILEAFQACGVRLDADNCHGFENSDLVADPA